ncbi:energy-converting hydrogenase A subunit M [Pontibacter aydingkolensis]|uniref:Uncharacterized protein n=1 Tax=Pontibacter aydingkolensis TaxID=1911536 RepID=A0ABS7CZE1_9BACT|nr:hypothetical protein [Pontibacter aydingkolensis]MBW7469190.1 hypothetical protein [Pontibacter aydingkolensis]
MQYSPAIISSATSRLQSIFEVDNLTVSNLEALRYKLSRAILHLLNNDFQKLLQILYRIDVDEQAVKEAMIADDTELIAERIAKLILKRELQKAELRQRYSGK